MKPHCRRRPTRASSDGRRVLVPVHSWPPAATASSVRLSGTTRLSPVAIDGQPMPHRACVVYAHHYRCVHPCAAPYCRRKRRGLRRGLGSRFSCMRAIQPSGVPFFISLQPANGTSGRAIYLCSCERVFGPSRGMGWQLKTSSKPAEGRCRPHKPPTALVVVPTARGYDGASPDFPSACDGTRARDGAVQRIPGCDLKRRVSPPQPN